MQCMQAPATIVVLCAVCPKPARPMSGEEVAIDFASLLLLHPDRGSQPVESEKCVFPRGQLPLPMEQQHLQIHARSRLR